MDNLDIQIVDSLTVNLNQEEYSTEGQVLNGIDVYIEDEQLLFEAALTQDSINLYTRETPDTIIFDAKDITDGISRIEDNITTLSSKIDNINIDTTDLAKEQTLLDKAEEIKQAVENAKPEIDTAELAKEDTLLAESQRIQDEVKNIDFLTVKNKVDEVKQAVDNIDLSPIENKVDDGVNTLSAKIDNIDLSAVESKVQEESVAIQSKIDNSVSKQGENPEATNTAIMLSLDTIKELIGEVTLIPNNDDVGEGNQAYTLVLNKTMSVNNGAIE